LSTIKKRGGQGAAIYKIKKPFSKRPKGLELASSPYWTRSELLREILQLKILD